MSGNIAKNCWGALEKVSAPRVYEKGETVYLQGNHAQEFFYLKSGSVRIFLSSENGSEKTLSVLKPGNIFGEAAFFDGMPRVSSARALARSEILRITRRGLLACIRQEPQLAMELLSRLSLTIRMLSAQVDAATFQQADERLAHLLLDLTGPDGRVRATHADLAALAGVSRVTVSRILSRFAANGWVRTGYREIRVADAGAFRRFLSAERTDAKKGTP